MSQKLIKAEFDGGLMQFNADGWFNATVAAARFGKRVDNWLANQDTQDYIAALNEITTSNTLNSSDLNDFNHRNSGYLANSNTANVRDLFDSNKGLSRVWIKTRRGNSGGTWLHPDLAVVFARWLDVRFAVWCDQQIKALLRGGLAPADLAPAQQDASAAFRHMCAVLQTARKAQGKETHSHHYQNEAKLIDFAVTGHFDGVDRSAITSKAELALFEAVEIRNGALIACGKDYSERKVELACFVAKLRAKAVPSVKVVNLPARSLFDSTIEKLIPPSAQAFC